YHFHLSPRHLFLSPPTLSIHQSGGIVSAFVSTCHLAVMTKPPIPPPSVRHEATVLHFFLSFSHVAVKIVATMVNVVVAFVVAVTVVAASFGSYCLAELQPCR
ncbi:hypothetical protein A2U01_0023794, partial [Trifolium medium]|nr:hypothetical protein [Trifolium medium]